MSRAKVALSVTALALGAVAVHEFWWWAWKMPSPSTGIKGAVRKRIYEDAKKEQLERNLTLERRMSKVFDEIEGV